MERAHRGLETAAATRRYLQEKTLPKATANLTLAHRSMEAGAASVLQMLDAERSLRQLRIEALEAELSERNAWIALEQAVGHPLVRFPSERDDASPQPPDDLKASPVTLQGDRSANGGPKEEKP